MNLQQCDELNTGVSLDQQFVPGPPSHNHFNLNDMDEKQDDQSGTQPVPSLSLSFPTTLQPELQNQSENQSPRGGSGGRRMSGSRERIPHYAPYPSPTSPRRLPSPRTSPREAQSPSSPSLSSPRNVKPSPDQGQLSPSAPYLASGPLRVGRHRRTVSDPRLMSRDMFSGLDRSFLDGSTPSPDGFATPKSPRASGRPASGDLTGISSRMVADVKGMNLSEEDNNTSEHDQQEQDQQDEQEQSAAPCHRRVHSDSESMKIFPSREGFRLIIPPDTLKHLKDIDDPDGSVTVLLAPEPGSNGNGESVLSTVNGVRVGQATQTAANNNNNNNNSKQTTRPKHYKCSKCGQPKKGHVCEYGQDKPPRHPKGSPHERTNSFPQNTFPQQNMNFLAMQQQQQQQQANQRMNLGGMGPLDHRLSFGASAGRSAGRSAAAGMHQDSIQAARQQLEASNMMSSFNARPEAFQLSLHDMTQPQPLQNPLSHPVQQISQSDPMINTSLMRPNSLSQMTMPRPDNDNLGAPIFSSFNGFEETHTAAFVGDPTRMPTTTGLNHLQHLSMSAFPPTNNELAFQPNPTQQDQLHTANMFGGNELHE